MPRSWLLVVRPLLLRDGLRSPRLRARTIQKLARTLSGGAVIVKHSAEAAPAPHRSVTTSETATGENKQIADALMISLAMIVRHELLDGCPQRSLAGGHTTTTENANAVGRNDSAIQRPSTRSECLSKFLRRSRCRQVMDVSQLAETHAGSRRTADRACAASTRKLNRPPNCTRTDFYRSDNAHRIEARPALRRPQSVWRIVNIRRNRCSLETAANISIRHVGSITRRGSYQQLTAIATSRDRDTAFYGATVRKHAVCGEALPSAGWPIDSSKQAPGDS
jgi:hypothetical protein